jgi:regulatory protein
MVRWPPWWRRWRNRLPDALELAYRYLGRRERTVAEVRARLQRAKLTGDEIDAALAELIRLGYLDDARYARVFTEDKRTLEDWGRERIERVLRERGVDPALIGAALGRPAGEGEEEDERALALLRRRFPRPSADARERERALGVLIRKGYESEVAYEVVRAWSAGVGTPGGAGAGTPGA